MPLPTVSFDPTKTLIAQHSYITFTPTAGSPASILSNDLTYEQTPEFVKREVVAADGLIRADRIVPTKQSESFKASVEDVKVLIDLFGTSLSGIKQGTVELWILDPSDATGKASFHVAQVGCIMTLDGSVTMKGTEFSKASVKFELTAKSVWAKDFTIV